MYILGKDKQKIFIESLHLIVKSDEEWVRHYLDPKSGQEWITFKFQPEYHGGGITVLRKDPLPDDIKTWIKYCFESENKDDPNGLGMELSDQYELWPDVIGWLEDNWPNIPKGRIKNFIEHLGILLPRNRRNTIGIPPNEVESDYQHFVDLASRAKQLIEAF